MEGTYIQANVVNLFDERYLGDMTTNLEGPPRPSPAIAGPSS
jgi:hypothetical protein